MRTVKLTRRDDPIFGSMVYMGDRLKYWEGQILFAPTGSTIEVFVDGPADDGMEEQHIFFQRVIQEWPALSSSIGRFLIEQSYEREPKIRIDSFRICSLSIPAGSIENADWEVSFDTLPDRDHIWAVHMKGLVPLGFVVDG